MCIATFAAVAGSTLSAVGSIASAGAAANSAKYQGQVATNAATVATQNAGYAATAGAAQTEKAGLKARAQLSGARASLAANGVDVNSGSPADIQASQRELGLLDTQTVANNAALKVYGYQTQAVADTAQAKLDRAQAGYDTTAGYINAAGDLLGNKNIDSFLSSGSFTPAGGPSLISGDPSVPEDYQWMQSPTSAGEAAGSFA